MSNINPKERFRKTGEQKKLWANMVDSPLFHEAAQAAYADYKLTQPETTDPVMAATIYQRLEGARKFLEALMSLSDDVGVPEKAAKPTLTY